MDLLITSIRNIISHEVIKASLLQERPPVYSQDVIDLDRNGTELVKKRLHNALCSGSHCVDVTVEDYSMGGTFDKVTKMLDSDRPQYVALSQELALKLTEAQTAGSVKQGTAIFLTGDCIIDDTQRRYVAIIKADSDQALQKRINDQGHIALTFISDTLMGESQKLFKIAFFAEMTDHDKCCDASSTVRPTEDFDIKVFDHNLVNSSNSSAAMYFYNTFLQCRLADNSKKLTKLFYNKSLSFIASLDIDPTEKIALKGSLISYLHSNIAIIEPSSFAKDYLGVKHQDDFVSYFRDSEISGAFSKDISLVKRYIKSQSIRFTSNVVITADPKVLRDSVVIDRESEEGWTLLKIKGEVEN